MSFPSNLFAGMPRDGDEPVFREPWQAHAFAMAVSLHAQGLFTWPEWAKALAEQIAKAQAAGDADVGDTYYHHWLATLETLVSRKGASDEGELARYRDAWHSAAHRTAHGRPIELREQDFIR
jgi:nitrile hydratase accessory protein